MAALSDYLESGLLSHIFRNTAFSRPGTISIALTSGVPKDSDNGSTIPELPTGVNGTSTNYSRIDLGDPALSGDYVWNSIGVDSGTAYQVFNSGQVNHSGYFYPLYLNINKAASVDPNGLTYTLQFNNFATEVFYAPQTNFSSGVQTKSNSYLNYEGNGFIKNKNQIVFGTALTEWGWVSGIAILDSGTYGQGNLLMYAQLSNPRYVYIGDNIRFDPNSLEISLK
jgi:hypothetical protein